MDWKDVGKKAISLGATLLGTALMGPAGGAIGATVAKALGTDPSDPKAVMDVLSKQADAAAKLKEIQIKHEEFITNAILADIQNARSLATAEIQAQGVPKWARAIQVLGRPFALYSTVAMYIYSKISVQFGLPTITLTEKDYYLIGSVFIFLFGARSIEKLKGKA